MLCPELAVTILGCGTSIGVPVIGCTCRVCSSEDPRDKRTRASILVSGAGTTLLVDTATDFYHQAVRERITRLDAVLYTHAHADHTHGIDDVRILNIYRGGALNCYGNAHTLEIITSRFDYAFTGRAEGAAPPLLKPRVVEGPFEVGALPVTPIDLLHGSWKILGYRVGRFAYLTDVRRIPDESWPLLQDLDTLVISALRKDPPHPTHVTFAEALELIERIGPRRAILTHMTHDILYAEDNAMLPKGVELAFDGMTLAIPAEGVAP